MSEYFSERDEELVSEIPNVITVENYCKWYNLYYITDDGQVKELHRIYPEFWDEVNTYDHSFEPKSVVKFALNHNLKIGSESYKAICHMYAEYASKDDSYLVDDENLPTEEDLNKVLVEDYGDWSNCFDYPLPLACKYYKAESKYYGSGAETIVEPLTFGVYKINRNLYEVQMIYKGRSPMKYMINDISKIGDAVNAYIWDMKEDNLIE